MGVFKRGVTWYIRYTRDGTIVRESTSAGSKRLALAILDKRKTEVAEGKHLDRQERPEMTFAELSEWYWDHHGQRKRSNGVRGRLKRLKSFFGNTPLLRITPELVNEYRQERIARDQVSQQTVNRDLQELKTMFNQIISSKRWRRVLENPVSYVKLAKERNERVRYLEYEEIQKLLASAADHLRPILVMALHTGMRRGEILNLRWTDIDFKNDNVHVREAKNGEGRYIPLSAELRRILQSLPSRFLGGYVFPSRLPRRKRKESHVVGQQHSYVDLKNSFSSALTKAGISDFRFHDLRHTFASQMVMNGADLNTVRELLGHKSIKMTLRYAHLSQTHKKKAIELIDAVFSTPQVTQKLTQEQNEAAVNFVTLTN
jgi:integrase